MRCLKCFVLLLLLLPQIASAASLDDIFKVELHDSKVYAVYVTLDLNSNCTVINFGLDISDFSFDNLSRLWSQTLTPTEIARCNVILSALNLQLLPIPPNSLSLIPPDTGWKVAVNGDYTSRPTRDAEGGTPGYRAAIGLPCIGDYNPDMTHTENFQWMHFWLSYDPDRQTPEAQYFAYCERTQ